VQDVRVWGDTNRGALVGGDQVGFADGFAFLLISEASLEDLNGRLEDPLPMNRFRPNFVVKGCGSYAEDGWSRRGPWRGGLARRYRR
jgi:uncharacterized protein YcbX